MKIHGEFTEIHVFYFNANGRKLTINYTEIHVFILTRIATQIDRELFVNTFRSLRNGEDMQKIKFMKIHGKFTEIHVFIITRIATN